MSMRWDPPRIVLLVASVILSMNVGVGMWWIGVVGSLLFFGCVVVLIGRVAVFGRDVWERLVVGSLAVFGTSTIFLVGLYLSVGRLDERMILLTLWLVTIGCLLVGSGRVMCFFPCPSIERNQPWLFSAISLLASLLLISLMVLARTDIPLVSPWNLFGPEPFVLLFVAIVSAILAARERDDDVPLIGWMFVTFSALSVSAIVYAIGFGFDPFLHRAAEEALVQTGVVEPVRLLYSGQYVIVAALHHLTGLSVKLIDIWLVPVVESLWLPIMATLGFEHGWGLTRRQARMWWIGILAIPFMLATFTVPFTVTYVLFLGFMVAYPWVARAPRVCFASVMLALVAAVLFHPLLAVPLLVFLFFERLVVGRQSFLARIAFIAAAVLLVGLTVPAMLAIASHTNLGGSLRLLVTKLPDFFRLFASPYWGPYPYIPWALDFLYDFRYWLPIVVFLTSLVVVCACTSVRANARGHLTFSLGLLMTIWGASTLFTFEGIIQHEQLEFALRLLQALYTFALPPLVVVFARLHRFEFGRVFLLALLVVVVWFFSYPQYNLKYPFFSPGVSAVDVEGVHLIEEASQGEPYLVLSHQLMSAAAIQEFGFAHTYRYEGQEILWYAIPTGGSLYGLYTSTIYEGPSQEAYLRMAQETGVRRIYFAAPAYWAWTPELLAELEEGADRLLNQEGMTIYEFTSFDIYDEDAGN